MQKIQKEMLRIMKKKFLSLSLSALMTLSLAACGSNEAAETTAASAAAETTEAAITAAETEAETKAEAETEAAEAAEAEGDASATGADRTDSEGIFVSVDWVKDVLDGKVAGYEDAIIAEASWGPAESNEAYTTAHIPGAIHVDTDSVESYEKYNFFPFEELSANLAGYGITADKPLIIYGADAGAARVVIAAMYAGVEDVKLMDGSIAAWQNAGYETEEGVVEPVAAEAFGLDAAGHPEYVVSCEEVYEKLQSGDENYKLISIRAPEEWRGETSGYAYIDYAGEPEGAVWGHAGLNAYDMSDYMNEDGSYVDYETVLSYMDEAGVTVESEAVFYCGTGWRACIPMLLLMDNGWDNVYLYDGGWFEWLMHPDYPVQVGDPASDDCVYTTVKELEPGKAVL